jgi:hypothetical protein
MAFIPCPSCRRHVRGGDTSCPFCAAALTSEHASRAVPASSSRLGRGALFAFAVTVTACGGSTEGEPVTADTGAVDTGTAKADTATTTDGFVNDTGGPVAAYGGPPIDSSVPDTAKADSGPADDDGGPAPAYGLPPPDSGS